MFQNEDGAAKLQLRNSRLAMLDAVPTLLMFIATDIAALEGTPF